MDQNLSKNTALKLVVILGIVSLFADMAYESARSISGQYLAILGASGTVVGVVAGLGELIGYGFRLISGYISDKSSKYWLVTFIGYTMSMVAVPLLALANQLPIAVVFIILERLGKAIRQPSRDAILSFATKETGRGMGFGIHQSLDQIGAVIGPLIVSAVLFYSGSYQLSFAILAIPAACALVTLTVAKSTYPRPHELEIDLPHLSLAETSKYYWLYLIAVSCVAAGFVDFPLIAYHFEKSSHIPSYWIPIFYALGMATDGLSGLIFGRLYDKKGVIVLIALTALTSFFVILVFLGGFYMAFLGMILWGIGMGSQESIMRAVISNIVPMNKRGTAFGIFNIWFGLSWFLGSALMGFLYDISLTALILFSLGIQLLAIPFLFYLKIRV